MIEITKGKDTKSSNKEELELLVDYFCLGFMYIRLEECAMARNLAAIIDKKLEEFNNESTNQDVLDYLTQKYLNKE